MSPEPDYRRHKLQLAATITIGGFIIAIILHGVQGWLLGRGYPYNSFLITPIQSFSDYFDPARAAKLPDPYIDPLIFYGPFSIATFWPGFLVPQTWAILCFFCLTLAGLFLVLAFSLRPLIPNPWLCVGTALVLMGVSYPVLFCFDRGNTETLISACVAAGIYFYSRGRPGTGTLFLVPAIACKFYPALLLAPLIRQRQWKWLVVAGLGVALLTGISLMLMPAPTPEVLRNFWNDSAFLKNFLVLENSMLEQSASPWNLYKIGLITAADLGWIHPVNFGFDGPLIVASYHIYSLLVLVTLATVGLYAAFLEKEFLRSLIPLLLVLSLSVPTGPDYRLLYADIALVLLVLVRSRRTFDLTALVLISIAVLPKKYFFLTYLGKSEVGYFDIPVQVLLNPPLVLTALALLLFDGQRALDGTWIRRRWTRLLASLQFR